MLNILYFTFANSSQSPLPTLREEDAALHRLLLPNALRRHYDIQREQFAGLRSIVNGLQHFGQHLTLFHYSGHAGRDVLVTEDGNTHINGLAQLLGQCRRLKIVVLNGCSTKSQVQRLLDAGVPAVVATSAPVDDPKATRFSIRFYEALSQMATFRQAFDRAAAEVQAMDGNLKIHRSIGPEKTESVGDAGLWGLYCAPGKEAVLQETLPHAVRQQHTVNGFAPNERLLPALWRALKDFSDDIQWEIKRPGFDENDANLQSRLVITSLPMPVGEQVRKLLCPSFGEEAALDQESMERLQQIVFTWQITMELLAITMLTQLWESLLLKEDLKIPHDAAEKILSFFQMTEEERARYDLLQLIGAMRQVLDGNDIQPFVDELPVLRRLLDEDEGFISSMLSLRLLHDKLLEDSVQPEDIAPLCRHAEESLSEFFADLGFLARYQIISIHGIDIEKYRHLLKPVFHHYIVSKRAFGAESKRTIKELNPMDNRSVLLEKSGKNTGLINLSPFLIDANSFDNKADKLSLHYFAARDDVHREYRYRHISDTRQWIPVSSSSYRDVEPQLNYFLELLTKHQDNL